MCLQCRLAVPLLGIFDPAVGTELSHLFTLKLSFYSFWLCLAWSIYFSLYTIYDCLLYLIYLQLLFSRYQCLQKIPFQVVIYTLLWWDLFPVWFSRKTSQGYQSYLFVPVIDCTTTIINRYIYVGASASNVSELLNLITFISLGNIIFIQRPNFVLSYTFLIYLVFHKNTQLIIMIIKYSIDIISFEALNSHIYGKNSYFQLQKIRD